MEVKNVKLTTEHIQDLINLLNDRVTLGVRGNLVGECKSLLNIIQALETALLEQPKVKKDEVKKDEVKK